MAMDEVSLEHRLSKMEGRLDRSIEIAEQTLSEARRTNGRVTMLENGAEIHMLEHAKAEQFAKGAESVRSSQQELSKRQLAKLGAFVGFCGTFGAIALKAVDAVLS